MFVTATTPAQLQSLVNIAKARGQKIVCRPRPAAAVSDHGGFDAPVEDFPLITNTQKRKAYLRRRLATLRPGYAEDYARSEAQSGLSLAREPNIYA